MLGIGSIINRLESQSLANFQEKISKFKYLNQINQRNDPNMNNIYIDN